MSKQRKYRQTSYEKNQSFNALVAWFHSFRYKKIISVFENYSLLNGGNTISVLEIGSAHGKMFSVLNEKFDIEYTGLEINSEFARTALERYGKYSNFNIVCGAAEDVLDKYISENVDIVIAMETLEHIPEHIVVRIVEKIAKTKLKLFLCSVPVEVGPIVWIKNLGSLLMGYSRYKEYTWKETFWAGLFNLDKLPPHTTGHKGFDWRWLAQTIRHNFKILEIKRFPFGSMPACLCTSVFFVAKLR